MERAKCVGRNWTRAGNAEARGVLHVGPSRFRWVCPDAFSNAQICPRSVPTTQLDECTLDNTYKAFRKVTQHVAAAIHAPSAKAPSELYADNQETPHRNC